MLSIWDEICKHNMQKHARPSTSMPWALPCSCCAVTTRACRSRRATASSPHASPICLRLHTTSSTWRLNWRASRERGWDQMDLVFLVRPPAKTPRAKAAHTAGQPREAPSWRVAVIEQREHASETRKGNRGGGCGRKKGGGAKQRAGSPLGAPSGTTRAAAATAAAGCCA